MAENTDPYGSRGIAAAEQRVRNRNNMARQYTRMSNGVNAPMTAPQMQNSAENARPAPSHAAEGAVPKPAKCDDNNSMQLIRLPFGNIDSERLLLILLIALLSSEGVDFVLIAALIYVMM